jgi:hypothetical protein
MTEAPVFDPGFFVIVRRGNRNMPSSSRRRLSLASSRARTLCCTVALGSPCVTSAAQATPETIALEYRAVSGCPNPEFFTTQVSARTAQVRFDVAGAVGSFRVAVESTEEGYVGVLSVIDRNGKTSVRSFQADRCENVIAALALVAALAVDPNAATTPGAPPVPAVEAESVPERAASNQAAREFHVACADLRSPYRARPEHRGSVGVVHRGEHPGPERSDAVPLGRIRRVRRSGKKGGGVGSRLSTESVLRGNRPDRPWCERSRLPLAGRTCRGLPLSRVAHHPEPSIALRGSRRGVASCTRQ